MINDLNDNFNMHFNNIINNIKSYILFIIINMIKIFSSNYQSFMNFIVSEKVIGLGIGILLGTQVGNFITSVNSIILTPIIKYIDDKNKNINSITYNIFGIDIKYGELLLSFINLIVSLLIIYVMWYFTNSENVHLIQNYVNGFITNIGMNETN